MNDQRLWVKIGLALAVLVAAVLFVWTRQPPQASLRGSPTPGATSSADASSGGSPSSTLGGSFPLPTSSATGGGSGTPRPGASLTLPTATAAPTPVRTPVPTTPPPLPGSQPPLPVRAAFYYPWFPESWKQQGMDPFTKYHPSLGFYDSSAPATIRQHIQAMQYGGIQVGISSWWGVGTRSDTRLPTILANTAGSSFRWSIYYEQESLGDPPVSQLARDLQYIRDHYAADPSFFKVAGRFVVFVYTDGADACAMATRWSEANAGINAYLVLKVFSGYRTCPSQPAGWHQYSAAKAADSQAGYDYSISPGFDKANEASPRLARDATRWAQNVRDMVASGAPFQLITTFNEWGEGTSIESASEWASASGFGTYLDILHANGQ
jgi:Glycosyl hydrolase family 99